jgi:hypothetical protein
MNIQAMMDGMSQQWQKERAGSQMTLGAMIDRLSAMPADTMIDGLISPHSYRGYYSDLAFEQGDKRMKASDLLSVCKGVMGEVFSGYKGGDFQMGRNTPVWVSCHGCTGPRLMAINDDGTLQTAEEPPYV